MVGGGIKIKNKLNIYQFKIVVFVKIPEIELFGNSLGKGLNLLLKKIIKDSLSINSMVLCLD